METSVAFRDYRVQYSIYNVYSETTQKIYIMGATCCKCVRPQNMESLNRKRIRDYFVGKLRFFRRNRVESILIQQMSTDKSDININRCRYSPLPSPVYDMVGVVTSGSHVSVVVNDQSESELIALDNNEDGNGPTVIIDTRNRMVRPKAAKGGRSITQILPTFVQELEQDVETLLYGNSTFNTTKNERPFMVANGVLRDTVLPGEVVSSENYFSRIAPSRPNLTVPAIKTAEQKHLENFMMRQKMKDIDSD